eukprot:gene27785-35852_t
MGARRQRGLCGCLWRCEPERAVRPHCTLPLLPDCLADATPPRHPWLGRTDQAGQLRAQRRHGGLTMPPAQATAEAARLQALQSYAILDTPAEDSFDQLATLAARVCQCPMAVVNFVDSDRQWFKAAVG